MNRLFAEGPSEPEPGRAGGPAVPISHRPRPPVARRFAAGVSGVRCRREVTEMGERELREKYGGKLVKAINRAIRAEVPGGPAALDTLTALAAAARQSRWTDRAGKDTPEAVAYYKHLREVVGRMDAEVRKRWGVTPDPKARETRHG
jgi:hypothetical protein